MNTRGLSGMTTNRIAGEPCTLMYKVKELQDDGSCDITDQPFETMGSVVPLAAKDVQRLQEGGIVIRSGISIVMAVAPAYRPDYILTPGLKKWRVVTWSFLEEYDSGTDPMGTVVAICDEVLIDHK